MTKYFAPNKALNMKYMKEALGRNVGKYIVLLAVTIMKKKSFDHHPFHHSIA